MKLLRTKLKLKQKAGSLSKSDKQVWEAIKAKPVVTNTNTKALPAAITSKPIITHQVHATNRERRALRRSQNVSHLQQTPSVPRFSIKSSSGTSAKKENRIEDASARQSTVLVKQSDPMSSLHVARSLRLSLQGPRLSKTERRARRIRLRAIQLSRPRRRVRTEGTITELRSILGLGEQPQQSYTLLAIDTEFVQHPTHRKVTEIGLTTLRVNDILGVEPGPFARNWMRQMKHCHIHINRPHVNRRLRPPIFAQTQNLSTLATKLLLGNFMSSLINGENVGRVALVGHEVMVDVLAILHDPDLGIDVREIGGSHVNLDRIFDTRVLGEDAIRHGAEFASLKLSSMLQYIGTDPQYHQKRKMIGLHNASNDAAYTMMNLVLLAIRWKELTSESLLPRLQAVERQPMTTLISQLAEWRRLTGSGRRVLDIRDGIQTERPAVQAKPGIKLKTAGEVEPEEPVRLLGWFARLLGRLRA